MVDLLEKFDADEHIYEKLSIKVEELIKNCLDRKLEYDKVVHNIESRVKKRKSLEEKLQLEEYKYKTLEEITDITGIRIITFFENDIEKISEVIRSEFVIDEEKSQNKKDKLSTNEFGYLSLQLVVSFTDARLSLSEYEDFKGIQFEIQIRSILQHAWAEIEHKIGKYKSIDEIPSGIDRKFSRIAGLLEIADEHFIEVRDELFSYRESLQEKIINEPETIGINKDSLVEFLSYSKSISEFNVFIEQNTNEVYFLPLSNEIDNLVDRLLFADIKSIDVLSSQLEKNKEKIFKLATALTQKPKNITFHIPFYVSVNYLIFILTSSNGLNYVETYLDKFNIGFLSERKGLAKVIFELVDSN